MENDPANAHFCALSTHPYYEEDPEEDCSTLSMTYGGWCGPERNRGVSVSCAHKVQSFIEARPAVLHADDLINKKSDKEVRYLLEELLRQRMPVQVRDAISSGANRAAAAIPARTS